MDLLAVGIIAAGIIIGITICGLIVWCTIPSGTGAQ